MESPFIVLAQVTSILEQRGIRYVLVGSLASSMHGMFRATADIDILADVKRDQADPLFDDLKYIFYVDDSAIRDAVLRRGSFNAIHFDSVFKVDIFLPKADEFDHKQLERRELRQFSPEVEQRIWVATAEDTILAKLRWFRASQETSSNQWSDVLGILAASATLDDAYLHYWATKLNVTDLLTKAINEVS